MAKSRYRERFLYNDGPLTVGMQMTTSTQPSDIKTIFLGVSLMVVSLWNTGYSAVTTFLRLAYFTALESIPHCRLGPMVISIFNSPKSYGLFLLSRIASYTRKLPSFSISSKVFLVLGVPFIRFLSTSFALCSGFLWIIFTPLALILCRVSRILFVPFFLVLPSFITHIFIIVPQGYLQ